MASYASEVLADNPLGYWRLGEASGTTAADDSGNGNDGTYGGSPTLGATGLLPRADDSDTAVDFDGVDDAVDTGLTVATGSDERTFEAWIQLNDGDDYYPFVHQGLNNAGERFTLRLNRAVSADGTPNTLRVDVSGGYIVGSTVITDGDPHHVVAVLPAGGSDVEDVLLYVDGQLETITDSGSQSLNTQAGDGVQIGYENGLARYADGVIDEVAVYDAALSASRISAHYTAGVTADNVAPNAPTCTVDSFTATGAELSSSAFSDPDDGDTHAASRWQVDVEGGDFSSPAYDSGFISDLEAHTVPEDSLDPATSYIARVAHQDAAGESTWSAATSAFTTDAWGSCGVAPAETWDPCAAPASEGGGGGDVYAMDFSSYDGDDWRNVFDPTVDPTGLNASAIAVAGAIGGYVLRDGVASRNATSEYGEVWRAGPSAADIEVVMKFRSSAWTDQRRFGVVFRCGDQNTTEGVVLSLGNFAGAIDVDFYRRSTSGSITGYGMSDSAFGLAILATDTWYWLRAKLSGNDAYLSLWEDGDSEPESFQASASSPADPVTHAGYVGIWTTLETGTRDVDFFGIGVDGESAPTEVPESAPWEACAAAGASAWSDC